MQNSISKAAKFWRLIFSGFIVLSLISCEEPNSVGGQFIGGSELKFDTLFVDDFTPQSETVFTGGLRYTPIGKYNDPLLGDAKSIAFLKPRIDAISFTENVDSSFKLKLELIFNNDLINGDSLDALNVDIFSVNEFWRGNNVTSGDEIGIDSTKKFGSFSQLSENSLMVDLSKDLLLELAAFINNDSTSTDSLYNYGFNGMALVPRDSDTKIIYPDMFESRFLIITPENDTTRFATKSHAFNVERSNANAFPDRLYLNSYFENFYTLTFEDILPEDKQVNLLKAELIVYEDVSQIKGSLPINHTRPEVNFLDLKFANPSDLRYELQFTAGDFLGVRDTLNNGFRFNITEHINQYFFTEPSDKTLYFNINPSGGIMRSTLLYDQTSSDSLKPKLILTFSE